MVYNRTGQSRFRSRAPISCLSSPSRLTRLSPHLEAPARPSRYGGACRPRRGAPASTRWAGFSWPRRSSDPPHSSASTHSLHAARSRFLMGPPKPVLTGAAPGERLEGRSPPVPCRRGLRSRLRGRAGKFSALSGNSIPNSTSFPRRRDPSPRGRRSPSIGCPKRLDSRLRGNDDVERGDSTKNLTALRLRGGRSTSPACLHDVGCRWPARPYSAWTEAPVWPGRPFLNSSSSGSEPTRISPLSR